MININKFSNTINLFLGIIFISSYSYAENPAFLNPEIPGQEYYEMIDYIDQSDSFVTAKVDIKMQEECGERYYYIRSREGDLFETETKLNFNDLTTVYEKRKNSKSGEVVESYENKGNGVIVFFNKERNINKRVKANGDYIYSRYAFIVSFRGYPFLKMNEVNFKSYVTEYGDALQMRLINLGKYNVKVKTGSFECYKLELSVAGWKSMVAKDKYYFYFNSEKPHQFIKYEEKVPNGRWISNELIFYKLN